MSKSPIKMEYSDHIRRWVREFMCFEIRTRKVIEFVENDILSSYQYIRINEFYCDQII